MKLSKRVLTILGLCLALISGGCATIPSPPASPKASRFERIVAVGDIHGSYDGLVSILKETGIIDEKEHWTGGRTLLVQDGDMLDRGAAVKPVMDLLMSLQRQAGGAGGKVVVILGNHEAMNIVGSRDYTNPDAYKSFTGAGSVEKQKRAFERWQAFFGAASAAEGENQDTVKQKWMAAHPPGFVEYTEALGPEGSYGKWLRSLPAVFRYGPTIFLHAGISPAYEESSPSEINRNVATEIEKFDQTKSYLMQKGYVEQYFTLPEIISVVDSIVSAADTQKLSPSLEAALPRLKEIKTYFDGFYDSSPLMSDDGPLWFRGLAWWSEDKFTPYIPGWLKKNDAWRVVVAHTPQPDGKIKSRLAGDIFLIDTGMNSAYFKGGQASALVIKDDDVSAVYATGKRDVFPPPPIYYGPEHVWTGPDGSPLPFHTVSDIEQFLASATPVSTEVIHTGVNKPLKVLLEKDGIRAHAIFRYQSDIEEGMSLNGADTDQHFRDSGMGEIAAYEMNRLLGLDNMPPTVPRVLNGKQGTMQLWAEQTMSDRQRALKKVLPPEAPPWNKQMWDLRIFDNLIDNTDRNQTNILIDNNWCLIPIDHTRTYAMDTSLSHPEQVIHCSRGLWYSLRHLDEAKVRDRLSPYLSSSEIDALFVRQGLLVQMIQQLIDEKGVENVLD